MAAGGVLELSQDCAEVGCFPGDAAGFSIEITASAGGSTFVLTSDLSVTETQTAVEINVDGVSINLNQFSTVGPNVYWLLG